MTVKQWFHRLPWLLIACVVVLMSAGLLGIARGDELIGPSNRILRQSIWIGLSLCVLVAATVIPYRDLRNSSYLLFLGSLVMLLLVYLMPARNGSRRWIPLGLMDFQPSELAKLTYIMALAHYLMHRRNYRTLLGLIPPFLLTVIPIGLILKEPDLGTSLLFIPVLYGMLLTAGAKIRHLSFIALLGAACVPVLWIGMSAEQKSRIVTLFTQEDASERIPSGDGYHLHQSKQVLALGGFEGSRLNGPAVGDETAYRLPAARTDFVFCLIGEYWGFWGCLVVMLAYALLFAKGLMIAMSTREPFGKLIAVGIVTLLATQTMINTGMTVGLMPITGMTLPLVSYGGSSMISTCLALGLLINVSIRPGYEIAGDPFRFSASTK